MDMNQDKMQIAVLIDSDNISSKYASIIFNELETYGFASYRRIYGNWSKNNGWNENVLLENSITPIQQFDYTTGKNSTDMTMVIDAMDILYSGNVDGFCLVTSDSDFTRLAMRLREANMYVIGMGESKTPSALTKACNKFIHMNLISESEQTAAKPASGKVSSDRTGSVDKASADQALKKKTSTVTPISEIENAVISIINSDENAGKPTNIGTVGQRLNSKFTDFDVRNYGYTKLLTFLRDKCPKLEITPANSSYLISIKELNSVADVHAEIISLIQKNKGSIDNLSIIYDHLKKKFPSFDLKNYGYNRISSFLKSINSLAVKENTVMLKTASKAKSPNPKKS